MGLICFGSGIFFGSLYFFTKDQNFGFLSANLTPSNPVKKIDLLVPRKSATLALSPANQKTSIPKVSTCLEGKSASSLIYLNEIAWMGSGSDAKAEWLELKNFGSSSINLNGWQILDKTQNIKLILSGNISAGGFRVFRRGADFTGTINNSDEVLNLFNSSCELVDNAAASPAWPAGKSDGRTLERGSDLTWRTSESIGGTPNAENPTPLNSVSVSAFSIPTTSPSTSTATSTISGTPSDVGSNQPNQNSQILISEVMVGNDASGSYEFIELYNAGGDADLSGWSVKKLSSTGSESSLVSKTRLEGFVLASGKYLLLANEKGYSGSPAADILWPGSYSLAYKENGVNLYNPDGKLADELYWPEIPKNQSYQRVSWEGANFKLGSPTPENSKK